MASLSSSICEPGSPSPAVGGNFPGKNVERALGLPSRVGKAACRAGGVDAGPCPPRKTCSPEPRPLSSLDARLPPPAHVVPASSMSSSRSWGASPRGPGPVSVLRIAGPLPHPHRAGFLAPPDAASLGAKNRPNSPVKGLLYVPGAARRGLVASHCPGPAPQREGSTQPAKPWPSSLRQRWGEGRDWLGHKRGCCWWALPWGGAGEPVAPKLGPFLLGEESASKKKKKEGELAESIRIASRSWSGESLGCSTVLGLQASRLPPPAFQPQNSEATTADVYPGSLLGSGAFVILLAGGRSTLLIPDTRPATGFLYYSSLSLIYLCPHTFPEAS